MATVTTTKTNRPAGHAPGETRRETMHRMLMKAREEGVQVQPFYNGKGTYVALSTGNRGAYLVRPGVVSAGCSCDGYRRHHYCKHYALACVAHGFQVELSTKCPDCKRGVERLTDNGICQRCEDTYWDAAYEAQREAQWDTEPDYEWLTAG